jgi:predicted peptidase
MFLTFMFAAAVFQTGVHTATLQRTNSPPVHYAISIPPDHSPSTRVPLVLALHFGGDPNGAGRAVLDILVRPALSELGAIIVSPDSQGGGWDTPENDRAVIQLLDEIIRTYSIDTRRVVVTGFSMGGRGTWYFGAKYPQRFSAAIPIAGFPSASAQQWTLPVLAIHSRNDEVAPFGPTEARIAELRKSGKRAELIAVNGISHYQTYRFVDSLRRAVPWLKELWKPQ